MQPSQQQSSDSEILALQERALRRRRSFARTAILAAPANPFHIRELRSGLVSLPLRFILHAVVAMFVPLAALLSTAALPTGLFRPLPTSSQQPLALPSADFTAFLAPLGLSDTTNDDQPVPDGAFAEIDALPVSPLALDLLEVRPVSASIAAEEGIVRGGPGTEYDKVASLAAGASLQLVARYGDWFKAEAADGQLVWVAAELLNTDLAAADLLPDAVSIPAPPPPKIGQVSVPELNLRDGPGTQYIGMTKLDPDIQLDLLARYQGWYQVQTPEGQLGWVASEFLTIGPGVVERIEEVAQIPDPNPALAGIVKQAQVNLRSGPGTAYARLNRLGADVALELLGYHKDWIKVRTPVGEGWISSELVDVSPFVMRRVPQVRNIPALPQVAQRAAQPSSSGGIRRPVQFAPASASGGPAQFALQFVGARYAWGGTNPDRGFDCSGFTRYVFSQFGIGLPHSAATQYSAHYGAVVSNPADLLPGDLVFFINTYKRGVSHVGIYIGGGNVVQALSPGRGVGIASLNSGYWASHYYGGIRPGQ